MSPLAAAWSRLFPLVLLAAFSMPTPAQFDVQWNIQGNTTSTEGKTVTLEMKISNADPGQTLRATAPTNLSASGTGYATLWKWPKPSSFDLLPGQTKTFKCTFKLQLRGQVTFTGRASAINDAGNTIYSDSVSSQSYTILPKQQTSGITGSAGEILVKAGKVSVPLRFVDEDSGSGIAGLSVFVGKIKKETDRFLLLVVDAQFRYPIQVLRLQGPSETAPPADGEAATLVDLALGYDPKPTLQGPIRTIETTFLGAVPADGTFTPTIDTRTLDALTKLFQAAGKSKLPKPAALSGKVKLDKKYDAATGSTVLDELATLLDGLDEHAVGSVVGTGLDTFPYAGGALAPITMIDLADPLLDTALATAYPTDEFLEVVFQVLTWGDLTLVALGPKVAKGFDKASTPASPPPSAVIDVSVAGATLDGGAADGAPFDPPDFGGTYTANSSASLFTAGAVLLDGAGEGTLTLPEGDYDTCAHKGGFLSAEDTLTLGAGGASVDATLSARLIVRGEVTPIADTDLLQAGTTTTAAVTFYDATDTEVPCPDDAVLWQLTSGPKGDVGSVDANGSVTVGKACGAGWVTAWCAGVQAAGVEFSTDCNGKLPPLPPAPKTGGTGDVEGGWQGSYSVTYPGTAYSPVPISCGNFLYQQSGSIFMTLFQTDSPEDGVDFVSGTWSMSNFKDVTTWPHCQSTDTIAIGGNIVSGSIAGSTFTGTLASADPDISFPFSMVVVHDDMDGNFSGGASGALSLEDN